MLSTAVKVSVALPWSDCEGGWSTKLLHSFSRARVFLKTRQCIRGVTSMIFYLSKEFFSSKLKTRKTKTRKDLTRSGSEISFWTKFRSVWFLLNRKWMNNWLAVFLEGRVFVERFSRDILWRAISDCLIKSRIQHSITTKAVNSLTLGALQCVLKRALWRNPSS